jgi:predicted RND superfamily exporter protein
MVKESFLGRLASFAGRHYRGVFLAFALALALAGFGASRLQFDTDVLNLLPPDDPVFQTFRETMENFGSFDNLLVGLRLPEGIAVEPYQDFSEELADGLRGMSELKAVEDRLQAPERLIEQILPAAVLYLDAEGRQELAARLSPAGVAQQVDELHRRLGTPLALGLRDLLKVDPLGISSLLLKRLEGARGSVEVDWQSGSYLSVDRRMLLILGEPTERPQNIGFDRRLVGGVEERFATLLARWPEIGGELPPPQLVLGGAYLTALDDARFIQGDMIRNTATSVLGVLLLFFFAFRRPSALLYALLPLAAGLLLTFGFAGFALGRLSNATSGVAALLIGLAIDFVIVSYGRYVEERQRGAGIGEALAQMSGSSGRAVVVGAVTTAATFGAFLCTDFPGLREMGLLTAVGILLCMVSVLLLLPALLSWSEARHRRRSSQPRLYLHGFGSEGLISFSLRRPGWVLAAAAVVTVVAAGYLPTIGFEDSMAAMRPKGNRGLDGAAQVAEHFGSGFDFTMLLISGDSLEEVLQGAAAASEGAQELVRSGVLSGYRSITSILPPLEDQREALAWLEQQRKAGLDSQRVAEDFRREATGQGLRASSFEAGLGLLAQALDRRQPLGVDEIGATEQGRRFLEQFLRGSDEAGWKSVVRLYPPDNRFRREAPEEVLALAERLGPKTAVAGSNVVNTRVREIVRRDALLAGLLGFVLVALLLWLDFRSLRDTLLSLIPLVVGIVWMLGAMAAFGLKANFMNIFVSTMIIGIGVDYGLHMIHRYREIEKTGDRDLLEGLQQTGKAVLAAALSTVVGFGSMSLSHYPGLRTTGYVAILGAVATAFVAITVLPALLELLARRLSGRRGSR